MKQKKKKLAGSSPERQRMIQVMTMKGLSPATQKSYQDGIGRLAKHYGRPPHLLTADEIADWVTARIEQGLCQRTTNAEISALRLFYIDALGQSEKVEGLHFRRVPDRLPRPIPQTDIRHLILAINDRRYRAAVITAYGAGLRISEVVALRVCDIRGEQGLIHINSGKGGHERMAHMPASVHQVLRSYWETTWPRPVSWLFYGDRPDQPITTGGLRLAFNKGRDRAGVDRAFTFHCLRHSAATYLHENGAPISVVQDFLGHKSAEATRVYARTTGSMFQKLDHPVNRLANTV